MITLSFAKQKMERIEGELKLSHARVMNLIKSHTNEEMMTKKYYTWVDKN